MQNWRVTIKATVVKTLEVEADTEDAAVEEAHSLFSVLPEEGCKEDYDEETLIVEKAD